DDEREKLIREAAEENTSADENLTFETEEEDFENLEQPAKPSKKKLFLAFVGFVFGFVLLVLILCWFFGIGVFVATKPQAVDRTAKTNSPNSATPVTEDEKLKMALNLVAEKNPNANTDSLVNSNESENVAANSNSSVDVPPVKAADLNEPVVVPDALSETTRNPVNPTTSNTTNSTKPQNSVISTENPSVLSVNNLSRMENQSNRQTENVPFGRSLFFGIERRENASQTNSVSQSNSQITVGNGNANSTNLQATAIPFGTLLPIRFLGAVYTLRTSGGLVRMELTRSVSGKNYFFPAGTVLVGTLRGSEYKRAFISVVGLIDPGSGGLVKFEGEVMGNDGASGIAGRRRQVKSNWSRVFGGLREAGAVALGAIGNRRSGDAVIISDSTSKASGVLSDELSGLIGSNRNPNEFVEISAGTTGFVLVTDLPDEISDAERLGQNSKTATGLTESELADLFTEGNREKIRAALPRMTPQFRQLAEKVLAME
ncbi:MAG: hypothetical protein M3Q33_00270, partial [Acidobacteriota bacterium]|nr:hypothetical protein [Acidobacteriota bacterium]